MSWRFAAASSLGTSHGKAGLPCQDAHACEVLVSAAGEPVLVAVVADGAGSAPRSEEGARLACDLVVGEVRALCESGGSVAGLAREEVRAWLSRFQDAIGVRAQAGELSPRDFACTLLAAVVGPGHAAFFQVGDGAMVVSDGDDYAWMFWPDNGEYENLTFFATDPKASDHLQFDLCARSIEEVALFSDGLQRLALHYQTRTAHQPFFRSLLGAVRGAEEGAAGALSARLAEYLDSPAINERTDDDKTLILAWPPALPPPTILDSRGRPVPLGASLGKGGEGEVREIAGDPKRVVKLYHKPLAGERAEKMRAMVRIQTEALTRIAAWPLDTCHRRAGGEIVGVLMPRVSGHQEIHNLYSPKSRLGAFPGANWKFLLHSAANLARAFAVVHEHGHLVGDINHGNVLVSSQATVRLIDCDSFQLLADGRQFLCEVGVSTHVPPELQGGSLRVLRTQNHDAFGLAVLIFQILFMGRHPYSGRYLGPGDMPIEKAIREHRFAYGALAPSRQMRQPPNTLDLAMASQPVAGLFERAFSSMASQGAARPGAREWATAIEGVKTATCARNSAHLHLQGLPACPWCDLESRTGTIFFYSLSIDLHADTFHLTAVWARIAAIPGPGPLPALPEPRSFPTAPSPATQAGAKTKRIRRIVAVVLTIAGVAGGLALGSSIIVAVAVVVAIALATTHTSEGQAARQRFRQAQDSLFQLQRQWPQQAGDEPFQSKLAELNRLQNEHRGLPALRQKKLAELEANRWNAQLEKFLDRYRIDQARIPNIGPGRTATLQSFGIETAQDVRPLDILRIPGFGSGLTDNLMAWRRSIEAKFVYDPSRGIDPADVQALDRNLSIRREQIERALLAGGAELEKIKYQISIRRQAIYQQVEAAARAVAQAEADFRVL